MRENNSGSSSGGIGFIGLLAIVFIVLKLCKVISWSWWLVTIPIWAPVSLGIVGLLIYLVVVLVVRIIGKEGK